MDRELRNVDRQLSQNLPTATDSDACSRLLATYILIKT